MSDENQNQEQQEQPQLQEQPLQEAASKFDPKFEHAIRSLLQQQSDLQAQKRQLQQNPVPQSQPQAQKKQASQQVQLQEQLAAVQQELQQFKRQQEQQLEAQRWDNVGRTVDQFIDEVEDFPALKAAKGLGLTQLVRDEIADHYHSQGKVMSPEEGASNVEAWLNKLVEQVGPALGYVKQGDSSATLTNSDSSQRSINSADPMDVIMHPEKYFK